MKNIRLLLFSILVTLAVVARINATSTGDGGEQFPLGADSGDNFDVGSGKLTVQGDTGNTGIGSSSPQTKLDVASTVTATAFSGSGAGLNSVAVSGWADGGTNVFLSTSTDNVGVGTYQPNSLLNISSTVSQDLFRVDDNGFGDTTPVVVRVDGNVGISTTQPNNTFQVSDLIFFDTVSSKNLYLGRTAGTGSSNLSLVGDNAGNSLSGGSESALFGYQSGFTLGSLRSSNVFFGYQSGYLNDSTTNIFLGNQAGYNEAGSS